MHNSPALLAAPPPQQLQEQAPPSPRPRAAVDSYAALASYTQLHPCTPKDRKFSVDPDATGRAGDTIAAWVPS